MVAGNDVLWPEQEPAENGPNAPVDPNAAADSGTADSGAAADLNAAADFAGVAGVTDVADVADFDSEDGPENPLRIPDEHALEDLLRHFTTQDSPRIFALCAVAKGWRRAEVVAWGMSFTDQAVLYLPGERSIGFFSSPQQAAQLFGMGRDVRLVWPDFVPLREMITT